MRGRISINVQCAQDDTRQYKEQIVIKEGSSNNLRSFWKAEEEVQFYRISMSTYCPLVVHFLNNYHGQIIVNTKTKWNVRFFFFFLHEMVFAVSLLEDTNLIGGGVAVNLECDRLTFIQWSNCLKLINNAEWATMMFDSFLDKILLKILFEEDIMYLILNKLFLFSKFQFTIRHYLQLYCMYKFAQHS